MVTLNDVLGYGNETDPATGQPRANAQQQAEAVKLWHKDTVDYGRAATADPKNPLSADDFWKGTLAVDDEVTETLETLRSAAMYNTSQNLFQDPEELASFWRVWESSGKDPENMDAPERWIENARAIDQIGQAAAFQAPRYQSGQIGVGPNILGHYLIREKEDGTGYQSFVQSAFPTKQQIRQADGTTKTVEALPPPITVDLPSIEAMRQQANERLQKATQDYNLYTPEVQDLAAQDGGGPLFSLDLVDKTKTRVAAAQARADMLNGKDLATALHVGLDNNLTGNDAFLNQLPGGPAAWAEQFSTRPLAQVARGLAQTTAGFLESGSALTQEGQDAVEIVTPGMLANRYENSLEGNAPIADLITSGIESSVTLLLPGGLAKLGGRAMLATKLGRAGAMANTMDDVVGAAAPGFFSGRASSAFVAENAGYGTMFGTAVGQSYAATAQEADTVEATDPAKAARLRRWNGLTSLAKGAIEMGTEKIFPGEMALLQGQRIGLRDLVKMPFQEYAEEGLGAVAQNAVNALTGQTQEDPLQAAKGGFFGAAPFVASAALAGRFSPQPAAPTDDTAPPADPGAGPDASLFPPANANPPDFSEAQPPSLLTGIAQRGGRVDPTIQDSAGVQVPTRGRSTAYGYANDETPDRNSSDGIGAWVSTAEAARIRAGEPSEMRLRPGDLAVSRDIEAQFREQGIRPGDPVTLNYADGTTHTGRWMDRTDGSLDGRFDLYSPDGPPANDGSRITGFSAGGVPGASPLSTLNPQLSTPPIPSTPEELEDGSPNLHPDGVTPDEVLAFQDAQDNYRAANPETATQPEPLRTLAAQLDLVRQGSKPSMIFEGVTRDQLPATMRPIAGRESTIDGVQTPGGYVVFNKAAIRPLVGLRVADPYTSVQAAARTAFNDPARAGWLLGYGTASKPANPTSGLVARAADGTEILAVVNDDNDPATTGQIETAINRAVAPRRALSVSAAAFRGSPLAEFVIQSGGIMSRSTARQSGMYRRSPGLWNDAPDRLADPTHNVIYGTTRPDEMAEAAVRAGLLPQGSTQRELWEALGNESSAARSTARAQRQVETDLANLERMARREDLDFTLALRAKSRRDEQRQASRQTAPPVSMAEPLPDPTDDPDYVPFARPSAPAMRFARPVAAAAPDPDIEQDEEADAEDDTEMGAATGVPFPESLSELSGFGSSIPLATGRSWERGRDLKVVLQQRVRAAAAAAGVDVTKPSPEQFDYLKRVAYQDVVSALKQNPNAVGWYDIKTRQALAVVSLIHPEIKTDPVAKFSFVWALAVTSNGQKVNKNFELAERAYRAYKTTGRMPTDIDGGQAQIAINEGLDLYNKLRAEWGIANLQKFMETTFTVKDIGSISKDLKPGGEFVATEVRGAAILGPKIGNGFFSNLYGHFDALTMDRWLVRTWGRWTGTLISEKPALTALAEIRLAEAVRSMSPAETAAMSGILGIDVTQTDAGALALRIAKVTVDKAKREAMPQTKAAQDLRRAGNSLAKYMDGQKEAPGGPGERQYIRAVFEGVLEEIRKDPKLKDMTMADMQAVLWYGEKRLYETAKKDDVDSSKDGYDDAEAPDYANAAAKLARDRGVSERSIKIALNKVANGRPAATRPTDGQAPSPIPAIPGGQPGPARDFTPREKRRFLGSLAARRQHANGRNPQSLPWNYRRDNRPDGSRARVLKSLGITYTAAWKGGSALKRTYAANGLAAPDMVELVPGDAAGAAAFANAITASKASKFGAAVYVYPVAEYQQMRLFLTADGTSGVAVKPDGDIVSVFSSPGANAGHALMSLAVTAGGTKLDAFDTMLPAFYADHGFRVASRLGWDDSQAPAGWDKQTFAEFNGGQPDVVFMVRDPDYQGWYDGSDGKRAASYDNALNIQQRALPKKPKPLRAAPAPAPAPASTAVKFARGAPGLNQSLEDGATERIQQTLENRQTAGDNFAALKPSIVALGNTNLKRAILTDRMNEIEERVRNGTITRQYFNQIFRQEYTRAAADWTDTEQFAVRHNLAPFITSLRFEGATQPTSKRWRDVENNRIDGNNAQSSLLAFSAAPAKPVTRGVSPKAAEQALSLIRQSLPAVADATRIVTNREALADEMGDYRPQDWADMGPGGVQAFYDPRTGQTTIFLENIEVREGETPMRAVARIILHERIAHAGLAVLRESDPAFARQWQQLIGQIPQDQLQAIAERYPELSGNLDALAEEWLASQVEARAGQLLPSNSLAGKMWAALKAALARVFGKFSRSQPLDAEVDRMIFIARNALKVQFVPAGPGPTLEAMARLHFLRAYHGTPHEVDKFMLQYIGTGEGAQAYGWGLYFAESKAVAEDYRRTLAQKAFIAKVKATYGEYDDSQEAKEELLANPDLTGYERRLLEALQADDWLGFEWPHQAVSAVLSKQAKNWDPSPETLAAAATFGNLYTVDILPNEEEFLDWDKPLSEQSEKVRAVLLSMVPPVGESRYWDAELNAAPTKSGEQYTADGSKFYKLLARGGYKKGSESLAAAGIPGIRYLDGQSRDGGKGTSNFVIFDEDLVKILEVNGQVKMARPRMNFARPGPIKAMFLPKANQSSNLFYNGEGAYRVKSQGWRATLTGNALPKEFTALLAQGKNETAALQQAAALIGQDLNVAIAAHAKKHGLTEADVLTLVDDAMANPTTLYALQDRPLREATRKARNFLDDMSEAVATITGGQLGSAIMANRGNWMRRSYAAFDPAAGWNYDAMEKAAKAGQSIAGQPAAKIMKDARDFLQAEDPARTPGQIEAILRSLMDRTNWERALTGQGVSKPTESLMRRKELPAALRAVMGEERNPLKRYTLSAGFQAAFIARHEQQERMAQIGQQMGIFSTQQTGVYTEELSDGAPTAQGQRRSGLAGLYTTPEMKAALSRAQGTTPDNLIYKAGDLIKFLSGEAKLNKVALSPDSYMVNLIGNVIGLVQTGDLLTLSTFGRMAEAIKVMNSGRPLAALGTAQAVLQETRRAHLARITAAGVADSSYSIADLQSSLDNKLLQFIEQDNLWNRASGGVRGAVLGQGLGRIAGTTGRAIGAVAGAAVGTALGGKRIVDAQRQIAQWTLGAPDRFGKIMAFQNNYEAHLASGMSDQAAFDLATEKTLNTMPDYSKMPELAKQLSQLGLMGSFIGFQIEVYRNAYHNFKYAAKELTSGKPALMALGARRFIGASTVQALALGGFQAIIAGIFGQGASDDEDEAYRRSLAKPYEKFGRLAYTALDGEKAAYFNTSYLLPQVTMWEIGRAALSGDSFETALENAAVAGRNQMAGGGVHTDPLLEALQNARKDGRPVSTETGYRQGAERVVYYLRRALEPGAIDKLDRTARAMDGRDRNSRTFTLEEEGLRLLGVRQTTYKHTETIKSRLYELDGAYTAAAATARTSWKDNAPGERAAAITRANARIAGIRADYEQFTKDLTTLRLLPLLQTVNDNRSADGTRRPILPKEFKPLVDTPDGPKPMSSK
jgi:hypothetical protein